MEAIIALLVILGVWNIILTVALLNVKESKDNLQQKLNRLPAQYELKRVEEKIDRSDERRRAFKEDYLEDFQVLKDILHKISERLGFEVWVRHQPEAKVVEISEIEKDEKDNNEE